MVPFMSLLESYQYLITMLESTKEKNHNWDNMNIKLFNEKFIRKEKDDFSQTMEVSLLAQKHLESKKNVKEKEKKDM
jgi:hypothetical protein